MSLKVISSEKDVSAFLKEITDILTAAKFDLSKDLDILPKKKNELPTDPFTTFNTLQSFEFDRNDIKSSFWP